MVSASAQEAQPVVEHHAKPVIEASAAVELPPVTAEETMPVLALDKADEPREKPRKLWDIVKVLPMAFYTPETSLGLGAGALFLFDMPGASAKRRPSSVSIAGIYTLEHQLVTQLVPELRFGDDDLVLRLELLGTKFPSRFYGTGNNPDSDEYDTFTDCYLRTGFEARVRPFRAGSALRDVYTGLRYKSYWSSIREKRPKKGSDESLFAEVEDPGEKRYFTSGVGPLVAWDTRDGLNWPLSGNYIELSGLFFEPWLNSDLRYQQASLDVRRYQPLWASHILALRFTHQSVWGDVPFQQLPQLGGANLLRGWYSGQLRDRQMIALEAEYRLPLGARFALVGFGSAGQVAERVRKYAWKNTHLAGGGGIRFAVDVKDRTNVRLDVAYGDRVQFYVHFREAF
jgi:hypothetical protein